MSKAAIAILLTSFGVYYYTDAYHEEFAQRAPGAFIYPKERRPVLPELTDACNQPMSNAPLMILNRIAGAPGLEIAWNPDTLFVATNAPALVGIGAKRAKPAKYGNGWWWVEGGWVFEVNGERDFPLAGLVGGQEYAIQAILPTGASVAYHVRMRMDADVTRR